jgi:hypothetical protein
MQWQLKTSTPFKMVEENRFFNLSISIKSQLGIVHSPLSIVQTLLEIV